MQDIETAAPAGRSSAGLSRRNLLGVASAGAVALGPVLFIHGEKAHSRYFSETAYAAAAEPKELVIIPGASHTDLYDRVNIIPFDKLTDFFTRSLAA